MGAFEHTGGARGSCQGVPGRGRLAHESLVSRVALLERERPIDLALTAHQASPEVWGSHCQRKARTAMAKPASAQTARTVSSKGMEARVPASL